MIRRCCVDQLNPPPKADITRTTPAMQLCLADHVWTISELVEAALHGTIDEPQGKRHGRFTAIDGGK